MQNVLWKRKKYNKTYKTEKKPNKNPSTLKVKAKAKLHVLHLNQHKWQTTESIWHFTLENNNNNNKNIKAQTHNITKTQQPTNIHTFTILNSSNEKANK